MDSHHYVGFIIFMSMLFGVSSSFVQANDTPVSPRLYDETTQFLLQIMNGDRFLSQGGSERVDLMIKDIDLKNKIVLDFGCGLGGPAEHLATKHQAIIHGIDIDSELVEAANAYMQQQQLADKVVCIANTTSVLPFPDNSIDVVFSKEVIVHVDQKLELFKEFARVLKPEGEFVLLDWFWRGDEPSIDLLKCFRLDGYGSGMNFVTLEEYIASLEQAGFSNLEVYDTSYLHLDDIRRESEELRYEKGEQIKQQYGELLLNESFESWKSHTTILETGEVSTYLIRGKKKNFN